MLRGRSIATKQTALLREIVTASLPDYPALDRSARRAVEHEVTEYLVSRIGAMPGFLRLPCRLALFAFGIHSFLCHGRSFRALTRAQRESFLARWGDAPLLPMRDFAKLVRGMALFVYFDHPVVRLHLDAEGERVVPPESRQASCR